MRTELLIGDTLVNGEGAVEKILDAAAGAQIAVALPRIAQHIEDKGRLYAPLEAQNTGAVGRAR